MPRPFVFNDEKVKNSYGFIIPTTGISLKRFKKNPMMLDSHLNSNHTVLGKWENTKADKGTLTGEPVFDSDDEHAAKIQGKVERGFISSCSMGITFNPDHLKYINGQLILEKCELYEVSIVAVPSNANSIRLYSSETGDLLKDQEVQKLCLSAIPVDFKKVDPITEKIQNENMKVTLTSAAALALGLAANQTEIESEELSAKITSLESEKKAAELKLSAKLQAEEEAKLQAITQQVELAVKNGQITADKKQDFVNLGIANPELLKSTLSAFPAKQSLGAQVDPKGNPEVKTVEDFQKLSHDAQLQFKQTQPEAYTQLFTKKQ